MKLRYFFAALAAGLGLMAAVSCDEDDYSLLDDLKVSSSYVAISTDGGSEEITVSASSSWSFDESLIPSWLTVSPLSGDAGETTVTFSADAVASGRNCELKIVVGSDEQYVYVMQGLATAVSSTCAEILAGEDGKLYMVTGTVKGISNTTYGNYYLYDDTGEVYVYGTLDASGNEKNFSSLGIEEGDLITVQGPRSTYGSTVELVNVTVLDIVKSLLKLDPSSVSLSKGDTTFTVKAYVKSGSTFEWSVADDDDWLYVSATSSVDDTVYVTMHASENTEPKPRTTTVTFTADNGSQTTELTLTAEQTGNAPDEVTVSEAIATDYAHVTATVAAITTQGYVITDDSGAMFAYHGKNWDNSLGIAVGDKVEIVGKVGAYNYGPQFSTFDLEEISEKGSGSYSYPSPTLIDSDFVTTLISSLGTDKTQPTLTVQYVQMNGTVKVSGSYINIVNSGIDGAQGSPYNASDETKALLVDGENKSVYGYLVSVSGSSTRYLNIAVTSVEDWDGTSTDVEKTYLDESFASDQGDFTIEDKTLPDGLSYVWKQGSYSGNTYMKASAYSGGTNYDAESWLISPSVDLSAANSYATLTFVQCVNSYFTTISDEAKLKVSGDGGTTWDDVTITYPSVSSGYSDFETQTVDLTDYIGKSDVKVAFAYKGNSQSSGTWEVTDVKLVAK